jgi:type 1 glutamine amidotransferase
MITLLLPVLLGVATPQEARPRIPVLLVTGANNHDWAWTSPSLERMLAESGKFEVTVSSEPARALAAEDLGERYQAIVLDYNGPRWGEPAESRFLDAVRGGLGVVVVHASNNAFDGWVDYEKLVGRCWREGTSHGRFHSFDVEIVDRDHPITRDLPEPRDHPDELYHGLVPMHGVETRVLATAYSDPESGGSGKDEPVAMVHPFGEGRVFHTPLGHVWEGQEATHSSHADSQFQNLIVRGTEWAATGRVIDGLEIPNYLDPDARQAGWQLLFDGETLDGWQVVGDDGAASPWSVVKGCLRLASGEGDHHLVSKGVYETFELEFEWKVARGAESGVRYRVQEHDGQLLGPEYQLVDEETRPDGENPITRSAAIAGLYGPRGKPPVPAGRFNLGRIVVTKEGKVEHWLNGLRVSAALIGSAHWQAALERVGLQDVPGFGQGAGPILLQDHGTEVWFRSIKIRELEERTGQAVDLFDGRTLDGWRALGDAHYTADAGSILGRTGGGAQSFLVTEASYGDFVLDVDVKTEAAGNSGIQVRSRVGADGRVCGYQIEIDPSERSWSGGLYDEARRGWLDDLADNPAGRAAFHHGDWNHYRIECVGPRIRAWVNGIPTADYLEPEDVEREGFIGLQVHAGDDTRVRWRDLRLTLPAEPTH